MISSTPGQVDAQLPKPAKFQRPRNVLQVDHRCRRPSSKKTQRRNKLPKIIPDILCFPIRRFERASALSAAPTAVRRAGAARGRRRTPHVRTAAGSGGHGPVPTDGVERRLRIGFREPSIEGARRAGLLVCVCLRCLVSTRSRNGFVRGIGLSLIRGRRHFEGLGVKETCACCA